MVDVVSVSYPLVSLIPWSIWYSFNIAQAATRMTINKTTIK